MDDKRDCKYQLGLDCDDKNCLSCGWNPEIKKKRIAAWKASLKKAKSKSKKR